MEVKPMDTALMKRALYVVMLALTSGLPWSEIPDRLEELCGGDEALFTQAACVMLAVM